MTPASRGAGAAAPHLDRSAAPRGRPTVGLDEAGDTPILREYRAVRQSVGEAVVLARLGDFYEMFGDDAVRAAPILGVALTGRGFGSAGRVPMCGVPHHAATQYIRRLLAAGLRVALWDQVEEPASARSGGRALVRREVTRVLSPGTVLDDELLDAAVALRCVAVAPAPGRLGIAALDAGSGDLQLCELAGELAPTVLAEELERLGAVELLVPDGTALPDGLVPAATRTELPPPLFDPRRGRQRLLDATATSSLRGFEVDDLDAGLAAAGAVLAYCERSRLRLRPGYLRPRRRALDATMRLDAATRRNLELLAPLGARGPALVGLLDRTCTPMGARLLRARIQEPLVDVAGIAARLGAVAALVDSPDLRLDLGDALAGVRDLERLVARCVQGTASPRDLGAVRAACETLPRCSEVAARLAGASPELGSAAASCTAPAGIPELLRARLVDEPPATAGEGGAIRPGADAELDRLRESGAGARSFISSLEARERERTSIRSLRVGYNRVFGYYIEVPNAHRHSVPDDYVRKQTLVGAERYLTPELREQETVVLSARDRGIAREAELLAECQREVAAAAGGLLDAASAIAVLDLSQALAAVADEQRWVRPVVDDSARLEFEAARHPLVELSLPAGGFVANDCVVEALGEDRSADAPPAVVVLTGPNMAGKSTYLRQVALIALLAQVGSFVPAARARVGICDRIFTRVGAQDDLAAGLSTFMVEMAETAAILNAATPRSLVVLDEIGRGTSTYDGLSIAQAVLEHICAAPQLGCRTLFATHYHELTALAAQFAGVANSRVEVREEGDEVSFLHRIVSGGADRSYGIHVARLAGIPHGVLRRARALLAEMEAARPLGPGPPRPDQLALPLAGDVTEHPVINELARLDLDGLTPLEALNKLAEWRDRVGP